MPCVAARVVNRLRIQRVMSLPMFLATRQQRNIFTEVQELYSLEQ